MANSFDQRGPKQAHKKPKLSDLPSKDAAAHEPDAYSRRETRQIQQALQGLRGPDPHATSDDSTKHDPERIAAMLRAVGHNAD